MERNQLIQLWAAEGFLHSNQINNMCMEEVGNMYFTILLDSNLFQDAEKDENGNVLNCKMHDLVHDMVQSISSSKTLRLTESGSDDKETFPIQYLALERSEKEMPFPPSERFKCITTFFLLEDRSLNDREISFFMLRVLTLRSSSVKELPKSIGKVTHLRYLDLSRTSIKTKPDSLCRLYNLQTLRVGYCKSMTKFPHNFKNLVNLRHFELQNCTKCKELPTVGHMPSLRSLHLEGLDRITKHRAFFFPLKLFPKLGYFIVKGMLNLTEWTKAIIHDRTVVGFPILEMMKIDNSPQLATFPTHFPSLKKLHIYRTKNGSAVMAYIYSQTILELSQPHTCIDNNATQRLVGLESLEKLAVCGCNSLKSISIPKGYKYLILPIEKLRVHECNNLISFPIDLTPTPSLSFLFISPCPELTDLPKGKLCSLRSLRSLTIGPFSETTELHSFLNLFDALQPPHHYFPSLSSLSLDGWPHWESLPEQLQHLSALTRLQLSGFGVKSLPDWFGKLSSLEHLWLRGCEKLENLPSHQSMRKLTKLIWLEISDCPLLMRRYKPESSGNAPPTPILSGPRCAIFPKLQLMGGCRSSGRTPFDMT
ncbi:unnamed protein product [Coffea canephora]|uniref:NB-ARC domain-containing protein n=1 Tax=Coffea canephora TaxID=49390 RepID=A0A068UQY9_COFCA|nr:unnamed protein product [Coffea canephora]